MFGTTKITKSGDLSPKNGIAQPVERQDNILKVIGAKPITVPNSNSKHMILTKLTAVLDCTRRTALNLLHRLKDNGMVTLSIEKMQPMQIGITQKGLAFLSSTPRIHGTENPHICQPRNLEMLILYSLEQHQRASHGKM